MTNPMDRAVASDTTLQRTRHLFRVFSVAFDVRKAFLGAVGLALMSAGWWLLSYLFVQVSPGSDPGFPIANRLSWPWQSHYWDAIDQAIEPRMGLVDVALESPLSALWQLHSYGKLTLQPVRDLVGPFRSLFGSYGLVGTTYSLCCCLWAVAVWSFFGGTITRMAAVQISQGQRIRTLEALTFARRRYLSYFGGPLIPLIAISGCAAIGLLGGAVGRIPGIGPHIGPLLGGLLWFLPLIGGLLMLLISLGWAFGWPLMFCTVSSEGSDTFDAVSRSWAYSIQRPWHYLGFVLIAVIYGAICTFFIFFCADLLVSLTLWSVNTGAPSGMVEQLTLYAPEASGWRVSQDEPANLSARIGAYCAAAWFYLLFMLLAGFVYSYFWSAAAAIYFLLRREVDGIDVEEVFLEGDDEDDADIDPLAVIQPPQEQTRDLPDD